MLASWRRLSARGPRVDALLRTALRLCGQPHPSSPVNPSHPAISQRKHQTPARHSSSSSRWLTRQTRDPYARDAKLQNLKSRAAFKLLELDSRHKLFRRGDAVVDLGYAPGSWAQVAVERTRPNGLVLGIDVIPAAPPKGVSTIQGNFLSEGVRELARRAVGEMVGQREARRNGTVGAAEGEAVDDAVSSERGKDAKVVAEDRPSYIDIERLVTSAEQAEEASSDNAAATAGAEQPEPAEKERLVDVSS
jgi:21S rRNA (uridine2791-2'-O)-methyltransferase